MPPSLIKPPKLMVYKFFFKPGARRPQHVPGILNHLHVGECVCLCVCVCVCVYVCARVHPRGH